MKKFALEEHIARREDMALRFTEPRGKQRPFPLQPGALEHLLPALCDDGEARLALMDRCGIQRAVLMNGSSGFDYIDDPERAARLCRSFNDYLFDDVVSHHPDRYLGYAVLPFTSGEAAAEELRRVMRKKGCVGAVISGQPRPGHFMDEECFEPFWQAAEETGAYLYLHPAETPQDALGMYRGYACLNGSTWSWNVDTATYLLRLIFSGTFDRHPNARVILGHLGETLPFEIARIDARWSVSPLDSKNLLLPSEYLKRNVWITTSGNLSAAALKCAMEVCGADRILFAVDYPFESMDAASAFMEEADISEEARRMICWENAETCFGKR